MCRPILPWAKRGLPILVLMGVFCASTSPVWIGRFVCRDVHTRGLLYVLSLLLMLLLPIIVAGWFPRVGGFDRTWRPSRRSHFLWVFGLAGLGYLWVALTVVLWMVFGFRMESDSLGVAQPVMPWAVLLRAFRVAILAPVAEEFFWRGYALDQLENALGKELDKKWPRSR